MRFSTVRSIVERRKHYNASHGSSLGNTDSHHHRIAQNHGCGHSSELAGGSRETGLYRKLQLLLASKGGSDKLVAEQRRPGCMGKV